MERARRKWRKLLRRSEAARPEWLKAEDEAFIISVATWFIKYGIRVRAARSGYFEYLF